MQKSLARDLIRQLDRLIPVLQTYASVLDPKLADYVFFPLSHVLAETKALPPRALELALRSLHILISSGWRQILSSDLGKQLLILLTFVAGGRDAKINNLDEEVGAVAFECIASLFRASVISSLSDDDGIQSEHIPLLGHAVTVLLDGLVDGPSTKIQLSAVEGVDALLSSLSDQEALRNFFPGIVTNLAKMLSPTSRPRRSYRAAEAGISTLENVITKVLGDAALARYNSRGRGSKIAQHDDSSWVKATSSQVKLALGNIVSLRYHDKVQVQDRLISLCISVLQDCQEALFNCTAMMLETLTTICSQDSEQGDLEKLPRVQRLLASNSKLVDTLKDSLYDWVIALPRVMESNDELKRRRHINLVSTGFRLIAPLNTEMVLLDGIMVSNLRSAVTAATRTSVSHTVATAPEGYREVAKLLHSDHPSIISSSAFEPVLFTGASRKDTMTSLQALTQQLSSLPVSTTLQRRLTDFLHTSALQDQKAALWLILQLLNAPQQRQEPASELDKFLNLPASESETSTLYEEAYAFSLQRLQKSTYDDQQIDWQLQCLALEAVAFQALTQKSDFRPELVDALYPILERMGSPHATLQQHAITTLKIVSSACGYSDASLCVVDNADYLVNSLSLKLNLFDISPQAAQVMVMMIRLCGKSLIPYLDDLVDSIFAILEAYHGYPKLAENLFEVLNAVVEESSIPTSTSSTIQPTISAQKYKPSTIAEAATRICSYLSRAQHRLHASAEQLELEQQDQPLECPEEAEKAVAAAPTSSSQPPDLLVRLTSLTPPHLSSPSPHLRSATLDLITTSIPLLSTSTLDSNTFLPFLAKLWPDLLPRLSDPVAYVQLAAAKCTEQAIGYSDGFLGSRVEESWSVIMEVWRKAGGASAAHGWSQAKLPARAQAVTRTNNIGRDGKGRLLQALQDMLLTIAETMTLEGEMEDQVIEMMAPCMSERGERGRRVREVLEMVNADAVWLWEMTRRANEAVEGGEDGKLEGLIDERPVVEGWDLVDPVF